jgi:hypothetical protein
MYGYATNLVVRNKERLTWEESYAPGIDQVWRNRMRRIREVRRQIGLSKANRLGTDVSRCKQEPEEKK